MEASLSDDWTGQFRIVMGAWDMRASLKTSSVQISLKLMDIHETKYIPALSMFQNGLQKKGIQNFIPTIYSISILFAPFSNLELSHIK